MCLLQAVDEYTTPSIEEHEKSAICEIFFGCLLSGLLLKEVVCSGVCFFVEMSSCVLVAMKESDKCLQKQWSYFINKTVDILLSQLHLVDCKERDMLTNVCTNKLSNLNFMAMIHNNK